MSPSLLQIAASIARARRTLALNRKIAKQVRGDERLHRSAMQRVFLCEDTLFLLVETHDMIARLEAQRSPPNTQPAAAGSTVKAASGF